MGLSRPLIAGSLGTVLVTLIGSSGGLLAAPEVSGFGRSRSVSLGSTTPSVQRATAPSSRALNPLTPPGEGPDD